MALWGEIPKVIPARLKATNHRRFSLQAAVRSSLTTSNYVDPREQVWRSRAISCGIEVIVNLARYSRSERKTTNLGLALLETDVTSGATRRTQPTQVGQKMAA